MPQYISKLILNGVTQMDVTQDTVAANNLLQGETATKNDGSPVTGTHMPTTPECCQLCHHHSGRPCNKC